MALWRCSSRLQHSLALVSQVLASKGNAGALCSAAAHNHQLHTGNAWQAALQVLQRTCAASGGPPLGSGWGLQRPASETISRSPAAVAADKGVQRWPGAPLLGLLQRRQASIVAQPAAEEPALLLTQNAVERMQELMQEDQKQSLLRLTVEAGGCSGFQYVFGLEECVHEDDRVFDQDGVRLVTDMVSLEHVKGATIDYTTDLIKSAFEVVNNPNAVGGCGCGASFEPKM